MPAADMFSFGVIAYELLTRALPFTPPLAVLKLKDQPGPPPPRLAGLCPSLDSSTARTFERCLSEEPDARPTAREVADLLAPVEGRGTRTG